MSSAQVDEIDPKKEEKNLQKFKKLDQQQSQLTSTDKAPVAVAKVVPIADKRGEDSSKGGFGDQRGRLEREREEDRQS